MEKEDMKRIIGIFTIVFAACNVGFSQFPLTWFNHLKEIKLLEYDRTEVRNTLSDFITDPVDDSDYYQVFSTYDMSAQVSFSIGDCSDDDQIWDIPKGKATAIEITPENPLPLDTIKIDLSKFNKERQYVDIPDSYVYSDKNRGIAFEVRENEITTIYLFPPKTTKVKLCKTEEAKRFASKSWFGDIKLQDRKGICVLVNQIANVVNVTLSVDRFEATDSNKQITVDVEALDPENDVLTYNYVVSGGKIIGSGAKVTWNLQSVPNGTYTMTVGVDDGAGIVGKTITKSVVIG